MTATSHSPTQVERRQQLTALESEVSQLIVSAPRDSLLQTNDDFMTYVIDLMNPALKLLHLACAICPSLEVANKGYVPRRAIVLGHLIRIRKHFEGFLMHVANGQLELAMMFARPIYETDLRMSYLMTARPPSFKHFKLISYRPEKEILPVVSKRNADPFLDRVGRRMHRHIMKRLQRDGLTKRQLIANRRWDLDGLSVRDLMKTLGADAMYSFSFGNMSHWTHGDWYEIEMYHLERDGRRFHPALRFTGPDPRPASALAAEALVSGAKYVAWAKTDKDQRWRRTAKRLVDELLRVDQLHETKLMK